MDCLAIIIIIIIIIRLYMRTFTVGAPQITGVEPLQFDKSKTATAVDQHQQRKYIDDKVRFPVLSDQPLYSLTRSFVSEICTFLVNFQTYGCRAPWEDLADWIIESYPWSKQLENGPALLRLRPEDVGYENKSQQSADKIGNESTPSRITPFDMSNDTETSLVNVCRCYNFNYNI